MARKIRYRRRNGSITWHWCKNCRHFPDKKFEETAKPPLTGLCTICNAKEKAGICEAE